VGRIKPFLSVAGGGWLIAARWKDVEGTLVGGGWVWWAREKVYRDGAEVGLVGTVKNRRVVLGQGEPGTALGDGKVQSA